MWYNIDELDILSGRRKGLHMKKNFALFLVLVMVMSVLIGCGTASSKTNSDVGKTKEIVSENNQHSDAAEENSTLGGATKIPDEDSIPSYGEVSEEMGSDEYLHKYSTFVSDDYLVYRGHDMEDEETDYKVHIVIKEINGYTYAQETMYGEIFLCFRGTGAKYVPMSHKLELPDGEIIDMQEVFNSFREAPEAVDDSNREGLGLVK